jgi:hypothetical protein
MNNKHFAEIIISSLQQWTAQSWQWNDRPDFASLMVVQDGQRTIFGLVYAIQTGSWQTERTPFPYQKTEEELLRDQPHIFEFLQTTFTCLTVGFQPDISHSPTLSPVRSLRVTDGGGSIEKLEQGIKAVVQMTYQFAPQPPKIHAFVRRATKDEAQAFFADDRYLTMIFAAHNEQCNLDELLLAILKNRSNSQQLSQDQFKKFIDTYCLLTGNDYRRLKLFLHRAQPVIFSENDGQAPAIN